MFIVFVLSSNLLATWPHKQIKNVDVIRMHSVCELMHLCPRQSIYFMAINAMGEKTVRVNSYVSRFGANTKKFMNDSLYLFSADSTSSVAFGLSCSVFKEKNSNVKPTSNWTWCFCRTKSKKCSTNQHLRQNYSQEGHPLKRDQGDKKSAFQSWTTAVFLTVRNPWAVSWTVRTRRPYHPHHRRHWMEMDCHSCHYAVVV